MEKPQAWKRDKLGNWDPGTFGWDEAEADMFLENKQQLAGQARFMRESGIDIG